MIGNLLDRFSHAELRAWRNAAEELKEYRLQQHFLLEGLRAVHDDELRDALLSAKSATVSADGWIRIVDYRYSLEPLSTRGSLHSGGRFNVGIDIDPSRFPAFPALYLAEDYETAYVEKFGGNDPESTDRLAGHEYALRNPSSFTSFRLAGKVDNVFDVGSMVNVKSFAGVLRKFEMPAELKSMARRLQVPKPWLISTASQLVLLATNWRFWPVQYGIPSNPQVFGGLLMDAGFEAVLYPSTKGSGRCLALFTRNLSASESVVKLKDQPPAGVQYPQLNKHTSSTSDEWK
ncbi:hypothetical protein BH24PSE2_BH24PSE2_20940 [soil metagenome]